MSKIDDSTTLLCRARTGDRAALGTLLESFRHYLDVKADLQFDQRLRGRAEPTDIVQQTLLEACRDFEAFNGEDDRALATWLARILEHNIAEAVRRHIVAAKRSTNVETSIDDSKTFRPKLAESLVGDELTPSGYFRRSETKDRVAQALARIPEGQRNAVWLKHIEGWSLREIAQHLNRSEEAVAGLLKRGLKQLTRVLHDDTR